MASDTLDDDQDNNTEPQQQTESKEAKHKQTPLLNIPSPTTQDSSQTPSPPSSNSSSPSSSSCLASRRLSDWRAGRPSNSPSYYRLNSSPGLPTSSASPPSPPAQDSSTLTGLLSPHVRQRYPFLAPQYAWSSALIAGSHPIQPPGSADVDWDGTRQTPGSPLLTRTRLLSHLALSLSSLSHTHTQLGEPLLSLKLATPLAFLWMGQASLSAVFISPYL